MKSYRETGLADNDRGLPWKRAPSPPPDVPGGVIVEDTVRCLACGYDLKGMSSNARCPECNFDIAESIRPEVRGFGGLMTLQRFRVALWMLALQPLVLMVCGVLRMPYEFRFRLIDFVTGPRPPLPPPLSYSSQPHRARIEAFRNQQYRQRWEEISAGLDVLLLLVVVIGAGITLGLLCARNRDANTIIRASLQQPRMMALRTTLIAFGVIVALSPIPFAITWELTWTWADSMLGPLGVLVPVSVWLIAAAFGWWAVSRVASGRIRVAFVSAASLLLIGGVLSIGSGTGLSISGEIAHTIVYAGLAMLALGAGLLWRWYAVGFGRQALAVLATLFAGAAPAMIVIACGSLDPTLSAGLLRLRPASAWFVITVSVFWGASLGVIVAWGVSSIRHRIAMLRRWNHF